MTSAPFWNKRARKYAASTIGDPVAYNYTLDRTRSYLNPDHHVLEFGCGTGSTALVLAPDVAKITGTDIASEMIKIAQEKATEADQTNAYFETAAAMDTTGTYDVILAHNLLHLTPQINAVIKHAHAMLPKGGYFISKTPCLSEPTIGFKRFAIAAMIPPMRLIGIAPHVGLMTFDTLETAISAAGFDLVEVGAFPAMSRYIVARKT